MDKLNLPRFDMKICEQNGKMLVFDPIRMLWVALTQEESVRQHFVNYLTQCLGYPKSHIANEYSINVNGALRRCDSIIYDNKGHAKIIVEYKAPSVKITSKVFTQILQYNLKLRVEYLIVSNGIEHYVVKLEGEEGKYRFENRVPLYSEICNR